MKLIVLAALTYSTVKVQGLRISDQSYDLTTGEAPFEVIAFEKNLKTNVNTWTESITPNPFLKDANACVHAASNKPVIFLHQNKAAGSSIKCMLRDHFPENYVCSEDSFAANKCAIQKDKHVQAAMGGYVMGGGAALLSNLGCSTLKQCHSFTFFREPIARLVSAYVYCKGHGHDDQLCASNHLNARTATIEQFADHWGNYLFRQLLLVGEEADRVQALFFDVGHSKTPTWYTQKQQLAGYDTLSQGNRSLHVFIDAMPRLFSMIGLVENFDESTSFMQAFMPGIQACKIKNAVRSPKEKEEEMTLLKSARENNQVQKSLAADIKIYEAASKLFHEQTVSKPSCA